MSSLSLFFAEYGMGGVFGSMNIKGKGLRLRFSSGAQGAFSVFDGFLYGVFANSIVIAAALTYSLTWQWPEANIPLGILMVCVAFFPMYTVYAMLTAIMGRAGGDYVWLSRGFGGFWGVVLVFTPLMVGPWFYMASNVAPGSSMVVVPLLISLGTILDWPALIEFTPLLSTRMGAWWFYVFYVTFAAVVLALGMRFYAKLQRWSFIIGMAALVSWVAMLLSGTSDAFQVLFSDFMARVFDWGDGDAYARVLDMAREDGFAAVPLAETNLRSTFLIGPALAYTFMYVAWTGTLVGEIRGVGRLRNSLSLYWGGNLFSMVVCAGFMWLLLSRVGNEFFSSSNYLWATGSGDIPVPPHYGVFLMALAKSPWVWLWVGVGLNAWFWIWPANNMVMSSRVMFAMSYDRVLPEGVSRISSRWGAPTVAIIICYVGCLVMGWLYYFTGFASLTLNMPFMTSIAFAASTLVGTLFPFLPSTRAIYRASPVSKKSVLGVPLITISGVLALIYFAVMFYLYITDDRYGVNDTLSAFFVLGSLALSALGYGAYSLYRKRQGIDISVAFKTVPSGCGAQDHDTARHTS